MIGLLADPAPGALRCTDDVAARLDRDIQAALIRGKSPYTLRDVYRWLWRGDLRLAIGDRMTGSATVRGGAVEVVHIGGEWDDAEARWMQGQIEEFSRETGLPWKWSGRRGWARFLRLRGYRP